MIIHQTAKAEKVPFKVLYVNKYVFQDNYKG